ETFWQETRRAYKHGHNETSDEQGHDRWFCRTRLGTAAPHEHCNTSDNRGQRNDACQLHGHRNGRAAPLTAPPAATTWATSWVDAPIHMPVISSGMPNK